MEANLKNTLLLSAGSEVHVISINSDDKKDFNQIFRFSFKNSNTEISIDIELNPDTTCHI